MMTNALIDALPSPLKSLSLVVVVALSLCGLTAVRAQPFSADLVIVRHEGAAAEPAGKLDVLGAKVRLETPELADGFFLVDGTTPSAYFVRPAARVFMDARQSSRLTRMFVPVDPDDPCRQWQAMAKLAGSADHGDWHCERAGEETIDGRSAITFEAASAAGRELVGWIDAERKFPLRIKTQDGAVITAKNIRDAPLPAQLFEIASSFRKFDPQALIRQIKQSDVWVAGQKDARD
jgi:hypothetical protein